MNKCKINGLLKVSCVSLFLLSSLGASVQAAPTDIAQAFTWTGLVPFGPGGDATYKIIKQGGAEFDDGILRIIEDTVTAGTYNVSAAGPMSFQIFKDNQGVWDKPITTFTANLSRIQFDHDGIFIDDTVQNPYYQFSLDNTPLHLQNSATVQAANAPVEVSVESVAPIALTPGTEIKVKAYIVVEDITD